MHKRILIILICLFAFSFGVRAEESLPTEEVPARIGGSFSMVSILAGFRLEYFLQGGEWGISGFNYDGRCEGFCLFNFAYQEGVLIRRFPLNKYSSTFMGVGLGQTVSGYSGQMASLTVMKVGIDFGEYSGMFCRVEACYPYLFGFSVGYNFGL
jgi:hypothetical protein